MKFLEYEFDATDLNAGQLVEKIMTKLCDKYEKPFDVVLAMRVIHAYLGVNIVRNITENTGRDFNVVLTEFSAEQAQIVQQMDGCESRAVLMKGKKDDKREAGEN